VVEPVASVVEPVASVVEPVLSVVEPVLSVVEPVEPLGETVSRPKAVNSRAVLGSPLRSPALAASTTG
jgi:hypothetical protein